MYKKLILLGFFSLVSCLAMTTAANAADSNLVGWWRFDENSGTVAADSSFNDNNGALVGSPQWIDGHIYGALEFDGDDDYVELPIGSVIDSLIDCTIAVWVNWTGFSVENDWQRIFDFGSGRSAYVFLTPSISSGGPVRFAIRTTKIGSEERVTANDPLPGGWHHLAVTISSANRTIILYIDGNVVARNASVVSKLSDIGNTTNNWLGRSQYEDDPYFQGSLDDFYIYNRVLSVDEVKNLMLGDRNPASTPNPANNAKDVPRDVVLSWVPGQYADNHDVYLGTVFEDVKNAGSDSPLLVSPAQDANSYDASRLEFSRTYYWRVDEMKTSPDLTIYQSRVWSFTVEPIAYSIPEDRITVSASSQAEGQEPEKTIDNSGLDVNDMHSTILTDMWLTAEGESSPAWIQYEFDKAYKLHKMLVWNYNGKSFLSKLGLKEVVVEYSLDGTNWTQMEGVSEFALATGQDDYAANTIVDFGGVAAKYVRITALSNWLPNIDRYGLSEIRFMYIPVYARYPNPQDWGTDASIDTTLGWRAGREASEHNVYFSADRQSVIDSIASAVTVSQAGYGPSLLNLGSTYYWRVDEVNNIEAIPIWQGDTWSFTTSEYLVVDDFESYNDLNPEEEGSNRIFFTWIDGFGNPSTNGSTIGYPDPAFNDGEHFVETEIVHGGNQSAPVFYDNTTASISEVTVNTDVLPIGRDWTVGAPKSLVLWIYGDPNNAVTEQMYVKVDDVKVTFDGDLTQAQWQDFSIDLASLGIDLSNVTTLTIGFERKGATGGSGMVFIDDIQLFSPVNDQALLE